MSEHMTKKERLQQQREEKQEKKAGTEKETMKKKGMVIGALTILVVLIIWGLSNSVKEGETVTTTYVDPSTGVATAPVLIEAYEDFQCPACAATAPVVEDVLEQYGDDVRFEYNDFPLPQHANAVPAAIGAECVMRQDIDAFWEYYTGLYANQNEWTEIASAGVLEDKLQEFALATGIDEDQFVECVASDDAADAVNEDLAEARALGVNSTPSFFVNGERVTAGPFSVSLPEAIDAALAASN